MAPCIAVLQLLWTLHGPLFKKMQVFVHVLYHYSSYPVLPSVLALFRLLCDLFGLIFLF